MIAVLMKEATLESDGTILRVIISTAYPTPICDVKSENETEVDLSGTSFEYISSNA